MTTLREAAQQALEALEEYQYRGAPFLACDGAVAALRTALAQQAESVEPVAWVLDGTDAVEFDRQTYHNGPEWTPLCKCADTPPQRKPLTIERLRDALVASRIIPPAAVEDPDEYDDGVTLHRIEALHRRLT